uniref:Uncharacterized protein n=1 Tax=Phytophthora fragariae TaxID=53985 RepID=A0A6A3DEX6_9STRA|nr:hypothetical protein PF009_g30862 [Phytophthora fragariae]
MLSAPGGTATSAFLGTSDRTRSSSTAHLDAPRRLPFSPQVQAHKKFKHTAPGGPTTSAFLGPGLSSAHLEAPRRLPFSARATAQAVQAQRTWRHHDVCRSWHKFKHTSSSSVAHLEAPRRLTFSAQPTAQALQAQRTLTHHDVCLSWHKQFKCSAPGGTATSAFLGTSDRTRSSSSSHLEAPRCLPFSARATAHAVQVQRTWRHHDVCLSRHERPHKQFMLSAPGGTATSAFLGTSDRTRSSSSAHLEAPRRLPFLAQVQAHKQFKRSAPGGTTTPTFFGSTDRTSSSSSAHVDAPRHLPFLAQAVQAQRTWRHYDVCLSRHERPHKQFMLSAPGGTATSAFLGTSDRTRSSCSVHLEAPRRLPFSAQATAHAVQVQRTWRHHDVCRSWHKFKHTSSSSAARL